MFSLQILFPIKDKTKMYNKSI